MTILWPVLTESPPCRLDEVHVWVVPLRSTLADGAASILSADEQQRAADYRFIEPRHRFIASRVALRMLLGKYLDTPPDAINFATGSQGKPQLDAASHSDLRFNLAHSGDLALVAITAGCEVGIDIEQLRAVSHLEQIARRYCHPAEIASIVTSTPMDRDRAFMRCWTNKEAILKSLGSGITGSLAEFVVPTYEFDARWIELPKASSNIHSRCWLQPLAPSSGYVAALACLGAERHVRCFAMSI